jgi:N-acetylmuramoyl-L-alanine amidase CwlA
MNAECIVVHNTSNDASAENEIAFMRNNDTKSTSYHYAVDDKEVRQAIPYNRNAYHAGDGEFGDGNRKGIGIEICYSKSGGKRFNDAEDNAAAFIAELLKEFGWDVDRVKKHQDFSGKYCPHRTLDLGWERFLSKVRGYMITELTEINDIVYELTSRGIVSNSDLWLMKLKSDTNSYWLARKMVHYIRKEGK